MWGSVSDRIGHKPVLMIDVMGYGLSLLLFSLSTQLWILYTYRKLSDLLASAGLATALAHVGDSTAEENRGEGMGSWLWV